MFAVAANNASVAAARAAAAPTSAGVRAAAAAPRVVSIQSHGNARRSGGVALSRRGGAGAAGHGLRMVRTAATEGELTTLRPSQSPALTLHASTQHSQSIWPSGVR